MICPKCGTECIQEEVDIGVGTQTSSWFCLNCGWNQGEELEELLV